MVSSSFTSPAIAFGPVHSEPLTFKMKTGCQAGCNGSVSRSKAKRIVEQLQKGVSQGVAFKASRLTGNIAGGVCSAMTFSFLRALAKVKATHPGASTSMALLALPDRLLQAASESHKLIQAAFNTIGRDESQVAEDFERAKIDSMAALYHFKTVEASESIDVHVADVKEKCASALKSLKRGEYVVRVLLPNDNEKGEETGHTIALVKTVSSLYLYDPNSGLDMFVKGGEVEFYSRLVAMNKMWKVRSLRMYRMEDLKKNLLPGGSTPSPVDRIVDESCSEPKDHWTTRFKNFILACLKSIAVFFRALFTKIVP